MASGAGLQRRISNLLRQFSATSRVVSLRTVTSSGGNDLLGLGQSLTTSDVVCDPQPTVNLLSAEQVGTSTGTYALGDYEMLFAGTIPEITLNTSLVVYGDEVLDILEVEAIAFQTVVVAWRVICRSMKSGS